MTFRNLSRAFMGNVSTIEKCRVIDVYGFFPVSRLREWRWCRVWCWEIGSSCTTISKLWQNLSCSVDPLLAKLFSKPWKNTIFTLVFEELICIQACTILVGFKWYLCSYATSPLGWSLNGCMHTYSSEVSKKPGVLATDCCSTWFSIEAFMVVLGSFVFK